MALCSLGGVAVIQRLIKVGRSLSWLVWQWLILPGSLHAYGLLGRLGRKQIEALDLGPGRFDVGGIKSRLSIWDLAGST
jgi:hypothetical protein